MCLRDEHLLPKVFTTIFLYILQKTHVFFESVENLQKSVIYSSKKRKIISIKFKK